MRKLSLLLAISVCGGAASAADPTAGWKLSMTFAQLAPAQRDQIFVAAGFKRSGGKWRGCDGASEVFLDDSWLDGGAVRDLNGDGRPEVLVGDSGTACYGMTGQGYVMLTPTAAGWKRVDEGPGIPHFLTTRGVGGWQDMEVGGPGFCFPVMRWNGKAYALHRHQYEGKSCTP